MSVDYHTAQVDFSVIVEKLPPMFLANFVMWLDLKVAEYKVFGQMVLDGKTENSTRYMNLNGRPGMFQTTNTDTLYEKDFPKVDMKGAETDDTDRHSHIAYPQGRQQEQNSFIQRSKPKTTVKHSTFENPHLAPQDIHFASSMKRRRVGESSEGSLKSPPISRQVTSSSCSFSNQFSKITPQSIAANRVSSSRHAYSGNEQSPVSSIEENLILKVETLVDTDQTVTDISQSYDNSLALTSTVSEANVHAAIPLECLVPAATGDDWNEVETDEIEAVCHLPTSSTLVQSGIINVDNYFTKGCDERMDLLREMRNARKMFPFKSKSEPHFQKAVDSVLSVFPFLSERMEEVQHSLQHNNKQLLSWSKIKKQRELQEQLHENMDSAYQEQMSTDAINDYIVIKADDLDASYS